MKHLRLGAAGLLGGALLHGTLLHGTLLGGALLVGVACAPELGALPARCGGEGASEGEQVCPEGYECIRGVCAEPGTEIPLTLATLQYLRSVDLRVVPQTSGALVTWQVYQYDTELHEFAGSRLRADGTSSEVMTLLAGYPANANYLEPYFDLIATSDDELLVSVGAAPADDAPESRLSQFAVHLPPAGQEASGAASELRWEQRMRTLGYGAVSRPRLTRSGDRVALGYFESLATQDETVGELAVFELALDGSRAAETACDEPPCCLGDSCFPTRNGASVAVGVVDAFAAADGAWWIIDDVRPSFVKETPGETEPFVSGSLPRLSIPLQATGSSLLFLQPSARGGRGLADDAVGGPAGLWRVSLDEDGSVGEPEKVADLPVIRDTPRPVWIAREGQPSLLVTPGADLDARTIVVLAVDPATGATSEVASIDRFADLPIAALQATIGGGALHVVWIDERADAATVRAAVLTDF